MESVSPTTAASAEAAVCAESPEASNERKPSRDSRRVGDPLPQASLARADPAGTGDTRPAELTRQELLAALDSEITQRQGAATQHGISHWGILAATAAL